MAQTSMRSRKRSRSAKMPAEARKKAEGELKNSS